MANCKVNIAEKVGKMYLDFGVLLLEDDDGSKIGAIEKEMGRNASDINRRILQLWLRGKGKQPVTWDTLIAVLRDIGLDTLAKGIEDFI